ncbi:hypothetical protein MTO96_034174 [Rhipicephalus appendiculatus]
MAAQDNIITLRERTDELASINVQKLRRALRECDTLILERDDSYIFNVQSRTRLASRLAALLLEENPLAREAHSVRGAITIQPIQHEGQFFLEATTTERMRRVTEMLLRYLLFLINHGCTPKDAASCKEPQSPPKVATGSSDRNHGG